MDAGPWRFSAITPQTRGAVMLTLLFAIIAVVTLLGNERQMQMMPPAVTVVPARRPPSRTEIVHGDASKKQVIFTFDGGGGAESAQAILATLAKHHVKGTFFLTGKFIEANPELVKTFVADGDEIFSHTYDHPHLPTLTDQQIKNELRQTESVLMRVAGVSPRPFFRPPYGERDARVLADAYGEGYESVYWTYDAKDWMEPNGETADQVRHNILDTLAPGNIYLMHFGDNLTGQVLDDVFTTIEAKGYKIVSLTQGLD
ncbi:MAG: polysaccharide deacetylase family protein [Patescibacteria group bacterium]|nr:polysaccharide deacetylase family protein [Patescibacteria group bacterium]